MAHFIERKFYQNKENEHPHPQGSFYPQYSTHEDYDALKRYHSSMNHHRESKRAALSNISNQQPPPPHKTSKYFELPTIASNPKYTKNDFLRTYQDIPEETESHYDGLMLKTRSDSDELNTEEDIRLTDEDFHGIGPSSFSPKIPTIQRPAHHPKYVTIPIDKDKDDLNSTFHRKFASPLFNQKDLLTPPVSNTEKRHEKENSLIEENHRLKEKNGELVYMLEEARKNLDKMKVEKEANIKEIEVQFANQISIVQQELSSKIKTQNLLLENKLASGERYQNEVKKVESELAAVNKDLLNTKANFQKQLEICNTEKQHLEASLKAKEEEKAQLKVSYAELEMKYGKLYEEKRAIEERHLKLDTKSYAKAVVYTEEQVDVMIQQLKNEQQKELGKAIDQERMEKENELRLVKEKWRKQATEKLQTMKERFTTLYESALVRNPKTIEYSIDSRKSIEALKDQVNALQDALNAERELGKKQLGALKTKLDIEWQSKLNLMHDELSIQISDELKRKFKSAWGEKMSKMKESWIEKKNELTVSLTESFNKKIGQLKKDFEHERRELLKKIALLKSKENTPHFSLKLDASLSDALTDSSNLFSFSGDEQQPEKARNNNTTESKNSLEKRKNMEDLFFMKTPTSQISKSKYNFY